MSKVTTANKGGWLFKMSSFDWHPHCLDGYPGWELETLDCPAFVKLTHTRGPSGSDVESNVLATKWDDLAEVEFYQRDWTSSGIPFVNEGEEYWSDWWFATIAEKDRFLDYLMEQNFSPRSIVFG